LSIYSHTAALLKDPIRLNRIRAEDRGPRAIRSDRAGTYFFPPLICQVVVLKDVFKSSQVKSIQLSSTKIPFHIISISFRNDQVNKLVAIIIITADLLVGRVNVADDDDHACMHA
jgi:hypothetical protein